MVPRRHKTSPGPRRQGTPLLECSAGGVVFKEEPQGIMVAFIKDLCGRWTLAKGHVEPGESLKEAAVRETREETGIRSLRIIAPLGRIELWFEDRYRPENKGRTVHKFVHYFLMQAAPGAFGRPEKTDKIKVMAWVPLEKAVAKSGYDDIVPLIRKAIRILRRRGEKKPLPPPPTPAPRRVREGGA